MQARGSRFEPGFKAAVRFVGSTKKDIHGGKRGCVAGNNIGFVRALPPPGKFTEALKREGVNSFFRDKTVKFSLERALPKPGTATSLSR